MKKGGEGDLGAFGSIPRGEHDKRALSRLLQKKRGIEMY